MKKLMGHFLTYQFTFDYLGAQMMSGRSQTNATRHWNRGLMCFCGHQMLWIMTRPTECKSDGTWSTAPAQKLSPADTMKKRADPDSCHQEDKTFPCCITPFTQDVKPYLLSGINPELTYAKYADMCDMCAEDLYQEPEVAQMKNNTHTNMLWFLE